MQEKIAAAQPRTGRCMHHEKKREDFSQNLSETTQEHSRAAPAGAGAPGSSSIPAPHHGAMIVRRSKSSAILPLRKHLIEKSLAQQQAKAIDEEQFYYQQKQKERLRIRPIEEVLEETKGENMDVDQTPTRQVPRHRRLQWSRSKLSIYSHFTTAPAELHGTSRHLWPLATRAQRGRCGSPLFSG